MGTLKRLFRNPYFTWIVAVVGVCLFFVADAIIEQEGIKREHTESEPFFTLAQMETYIEEDQTYLLERVTFAGGDYFVLRGSVENLTEEDKEFSVRIMEGGELYDGNYFSVPAGDTLELDERYSYGQTQHGEDGLLVIALSSAEEIRFTELSGYRGSMEDGVTGFTRLCFCASVSAAILCCVYVVLRIGCKIKETGLKQINERIDAAYRDRTNWLKSHAEYFIVFAIVFCGLCFLYRNADLLRPLEFSKYGSDEHGAIFAVNALKQGNLNYTEPYAGGFYGADSFESPLADRFMVLFLWILSYFADGTYLIVNLFFLGTFFFNAFLAVFSCRELKMKPASTVLVSVLFAFSAFAQQRYKHLGLELYGMLPLAVTVAFHIMQGDYAEEVPGSGRKEPLMKGILISVLAAQTGIYYTFFVCILYAAAVVIYLLDHPRSVRKTIAALYMILSGVAAVAINVIPYFIFRFTHGSGNDEQMLHNALYASEAYGLRIFRLLLPRPDHRFGFMRVLADYVPKDVGIYKFCINESTDVTLGIIGSVGFVLAILWLFRPGITKERKNIARLNLIVLLVAVSGGVGTVFSILVFSAFRSFCRLSLVIFFLSLVSIGLVLEEQMCKLSRSLGCAIVAALLIFGFLDQTVTYEPEGLDNYEELREFLSFTDYCLPEESSVFCLPYMPYPVGGSPEWMIATTETDRIRFAIAAYSGRPYDVWYRHMSGAYADELRNYLKNSGFDALFLDTGLLEERYSEEEIDLITAELKEEFGEVPFTTESHRYMMWFLE